MPTPAARAPIDPPGGPDDSAATASPAAAEEGHEAEGCTGKDSSRGLESSWSERISGMLECGTARAAGGLEVCGRRVADGIRAVVPAVEGGISSYSDIACSELDPVNVDAAALSGAAARLEGVRLVTRTAAVASQQLTATVCGGCVSVGTGIASRLQEAGVVSQESGVGRLVAATAGAVADVAGASFDATSAVASAARGGMLEVVQHRYGNEAGVAVRTGMDVVGDVVEVGGHVRSLGRPTTLARALGSGLTSTGAEGVTFTDRVTRQTIRLFAEHGKLRYTVDSQKRAPIRAVKYWASGPAVFFPGEDDARRGANLPEDCADILAAIKALCVELSIPTDIAVP